MGKKTPRILVCPLDWGIGHATRSVSIINEFMQQGAEVLLAASGRPAAFLQKEFPKMKLIDFPGYTVEYSARKVMTLKLALQVPGFVKGLQRENTILQQYIDKYEIDAVYSDNRLGCFSDKVPCVILSHQIYVRSPLRFKSIDPLFQKINLKYLNRFDEVWIPDYEDDQNLSGELSHKHVLPPNFVFIGPQSRFVQLITKFNPKFKSVVSILVLISGPEPQRTVFENLVTEQAMTRDENILILGGKPEENITSKLRPGLEIISHVDSNTLAHLIREAELVISRPGYSTLMDLAVFGKKAIFIPTPAQPEQEYIGNRLMQKGKFLCMNQNKFNLGKAIVEGSNYPGFHRIENNHVLKARVQALIEKVSH